MKKLTLVLAVTIMLAFVASMVAEKASAFNISTAVLGPENDSGVTATMVFIGTRPGNVKVAGFSRKLFRILGDGPFFFSLLYHNATCAPDTAAFVDFWFKNRRGKGRLFAKVDLKESFENFNSVSIRDVRINEGRGPDALVACGVIHHPN